MTRRWLRSLAIVLAGLFIAWIAGFSLYLQDIRMAENAQNARPDLLLPLPQAAETAIIVLTGGSERVLAGLNLLQQGNGRRLFISGGGANLPDVLAGLPHDPLLAQCCIDLGREAGNTAGNARESLLWLAEKKFQRIILVTAHYHLRRSLLEFRLLAPTALDIIPYPVTTARVQVSGWWQRPRTALLLLTEYAKLLVTALRYGLNRLS